MRAMAAGAALLAAALAAGCGAQQGKDAAGGKLAARVNGTEITMQQVGVARATSPLQALDKVIDRELLVQQALAARLDREPRVVQALEDARRQVLAQAWLERAAAERARSTPEEVRAFYEENPALFRERRVYRLRELAVAAGQGGADALAAQIRAEAAAARDLDELAAWLRWRNLRVGPASGATHAAEHLPLGHLAQLARMKEGEIAVFPSGEGEPAGATVVQLVHAAPAPLSLEDAAPVIERFLAGRKRLELAAAEAKRLRGAASIEYVGDFKR